MLKIKHNYVHKHNIMIRMVFKMRIINVKYFGVICCILDKLKKKTIKVNDERAQKLD